MSLGSIISILISSGKMIYNTGSLLAEGVGHVRSGAGKTLVDRCLEIIETLQQVDRKYITTAKTQRLVQAIVNGLNWCSRYEKMLYAKKVIFVKRYKSAFREYHNELSKYYYDLSMSILLTGIFPEQALVL